MSPPAVILIYGHDPMLLDTRRWVLERAGFVVCTIASMDRAAQVVADHSVDLFLLCHTLTAAERRLAVATVSALQPQVRMLVMATDTQEAGQEGIEEEGLHIFAGAEGLIAAARKLLNGAGAA